ncbi:MAG: hypothetical protein WCF81_08270 [Roseiarcus sp.]
MRGSPVSWLDPGIAGLFENRLGLRGRKILNFPELARTHRSTDLADGPDLYQTFKAKKDGCVKVVIHPA